MAKCKLIDGHFANKYNFGALSFPTFGGGVLVVLGMFRPQT